MALPMDVLTHINNRLMSIYHTLDHFSHLKVYYLLERLEYFSGKASHFSTIVSDIILEQKEKVNK